MSSHTTQLWAVLATIRRTQGRIGEVFADILTDFPEKFSERKSVSLVDAKGEARPAEIESHWLHKGGVVLKFASVNSITEAEALKGLDVAIPREQRVPLGEDEAYISDLIGCDLIDLSTNPPNLLGRISGVDKDSTQVPLLVVEAKQGEILVPFARAYLRKLDIAGRRVEMALPEGLEDLG
jgi:16S rRNA processing protein RimM